MKTKLFTGLSIGMLLLAPVAAQATLKTYTNRALFNIDVGSTTLIDFEAQQKNKVTFYGSNLTVGNVSFTQANSDFYVISPGVLNTNSVTGNYLISNNGTKPVVINFASSVSAVGMDLGWFKSTYYSGNTMNIVLNNDEFFTKYNVPGPLFGTNTPMGFVGFSSDIPFSSITINDPSGTVMIDNFAYTATPTPEPATMLLLGTGFAALAGARKLKKQLPA
jgi:hypothetical protein